MRTNSEIVDIITSLYKQKNWSLSEFARKLGMPKSSLSRYLNKSRQFPVNKADLFAEVLNIDVEYILGLDNNNNSSISVLSTHIQDTLQKITTTSSQLDHHRQLIVLDTAKKQLEDQEISNNTKLYEYQVYEKLSAGNGYSYFGDGNYDTVFYDEKIDHDFASWVFGDSMEPIYLNGEVALIKQGGFDYDGGIYAVEWDGQTYIKKVYREDGGLRLVSLNKKYDDKFAKFEEEPRIIGKIVGNFMPREY